MPNYFLFKYHRLTRRLRRQARSAGASISAYIHRHIWGKWHQVRVVRRFLFVWWVIVAVALVGTVKQVSWLRHANFINLPVAGGVYTEAALGQVKILNPVLPDDSASADINRLIFSGLMQYNAKRQLVPDLASSWKVSSDGRTYTFNLRPGVKWHDGVPFTSTDVAFTIAAIQNPDSRSPLATSWQGVKVNTPNDGTVVFTLPTPLSSFLDSTTQGIVPRHLLEQVDPPTLREADFNRHPVGTGPFELKTFAPSADEIGLSANPDYYLGRPKLDGFTFHFYDSSADALTAYAQHQVTAVGQIMPSDVAAAAKLTNLNQYENPLPDETTLFFNNGDAALGDAALRTIMSRALDRKAIAAAATGSVGLPLSQPLLPGEVGYTAKYAPAMLSSFAAASALDDAGWKSADGVRTKNGHQLVFQLVTADTPELTAAAHKIAGQLGAIGVKVSVKAVTTAELQQTYMRPRNFQLLLFGLNLGGDSDVYAFWHSSQAKDPGINLSGYKSAAADAALEAGRIKTDAAVRTAKYDAFLKAWNTDNPAAVLYESSYDYGVSATADGPVGHGIVLPADRFYNVQTWTVRRRFGPSLP